MDVGAVEQLTLLVVTVAAGAVVARVVGAVSRRRR